MGEHTPTPWRTDEEVDHEAILGPDGMMVADCAIFHLKIPLERLSANAAFIVKACNTHADLVKALEEILSAEKEFREGMPDGWEGDPLTDACEAARQALAKVQT